MTFNDFMWQVGPSHHQFDVFANSRKGPYNIIDSYLEICQVVPSAVPVMSACNGVHTALHVHCGDQGH